MSPPPPALFLTVHVVAHAQWSDLNATLSYPGHYGSIGEGTNKYLLTVMQPSWSTRVKVECTAAEQERTMMTRLTRLIATAAGAVLVASSALAADLPPLAKKDRYKV